MAFTQDELDAFNTILDQRLSVLRQELEQFFEERIYTLQSELEQHFSSLQQDNMPRHPLAPAEMPVADAPETSEDFGGIEISWDELLQGLDKTLNERLSSLNEMIRSTIKHMEHYLSTQLYNLQKDLFHGQASPYSGVNIQAIFASIEHLERVIESMQVAMTANQALLSNRLYQHQQLPLERAHAHDQSSPSSVSDEASSANHQVPSSTIQQDEA
jgi:hypothetical protein